MKNNFFFKKEYSNIYKTTSRFSEVTSQILYGEKFKILSKNKNWIKIKSLFDNYSSTNSVGQCTHAPGGSSTMVPDILSTRTSLTSLPQ